MKLRKIFYGLLTVFSIRKLGYFIPYRYAGQVRVKNSTNPWLLERFSELSNNVFIETLKSVQPYIGDLKKIVMQNLTIFCLLFFLMMKFKFLGIIVLLQILLD